MTRPDADTYFLNIASVVATRSTCLRVPQGVGSVLVRDKHILATGYAGSIRGAPHCTEVGCFINEKTGGCERTTHSEQNCVIQAAQHGVSVEGATLYCTMSPCLVCFKICANAGVRRIVYLTEYRIVEPQKTWAAECGIEWLHAGDRKYVPGRQS